MRLAVDVMGGDHAPDEILKGCLDGLGHLDPSDRLILVGPEDVIRETLDERRVRDERLEIEHAPDVIAMDDKPAIAVRGKPDSSIVKMALLGSPKVDRPVDAVLSAGNTGACVAAGIMHMKRLRGVHRPGIAVTVPAFHGPVVMCDAGANPDPTPIHLWQYAIMADMLARRTLGIETPRVGIMNIGSEEAKGSDLVREARDLLKKTPGINYIGFVEGRDFFAGVADVIITDGFVGNSMLKMAEGLAKSIFEALFSELMQHDPGLALQLEPVVKGIYKKNDYHEFGGAPLLGVNGTMMIAHGSSEARTIAAAIRNTKHFVEMKVNDAIAERLAECESVDTTAAALA